MHLDSGSLRVTTGTFASLSFPHFHAHQSLFSISELLPRRLFLPSMFRPRIYGLFGTSKYHRCYAYSAAKFNAAKSRFPAHWELHRDRQPSNELIRYMRRWGEKLRLEARNSLTRWTPQQRDVPIAACIEFQFAYRLLKEWSMARSKQALAAWRKGSQADAQNPQPRWNATHRWEMATLITITEKRIAAQDERQAPFGGKRGGIKLGVLALAGTLDLAYFCIGPLLDFMWK